MNTQLENYHLTHRLAFLFPSDNPAYAWEINAGLRGPDGNGLPLLLEGEDVGWLVTASDVPDEKDVLGPSKVQLEVYVGKSRYDEVNGMQVRLERNSDGVIVALVLIRQQ